MGDLLGQSIWFWMIAGLALSVSELVIPGGIIVFLGLGAFVVSLSIYFDFIDNWVHALTLWFAASLLLIVMLRGLAQKVVGGDFSQTSSDEDNDALGLAATVLEKVGPGQPGRIHFRGTSWSAKSKRQEFLPGTQVIITGRDNITWIIDSTSNEE